MRSIPLLLLLLALPALAQEAAPAPAPEAAPAAAPTPPPAAEVPPAPPAAEPAPVPVPAPVPAPIPDPAPLTAAPPSADLATPPPAAEPPATPAPPPPAAVALPRYGVRLLAGFPDAVALDMVYRPVPYLRVQAGPSWNYLSFGFQAGVAVTPIRWYISPVLEATYGHFFHGNANRFYKPGANERTDMSELLRRVAYDYLSGQLSLEFGSRGGSCFTLGVGLSYFWMNLHGSVTSLPDPAAPPGSQITRVTMTNPKLRAVVPSLRLGWLIYF